MKTSTQLTGIFLLLLLLGLAISACDQKPTADLSATPKIPQRNFSPQKLALGKQVYEKYCVKCHGKNAVGDAAWRKRDANGKFPPPPLNGSGHTWHHSISVLKAQIYNGGMDNGGSMPAFGDRLNEQEIESVIDWVQSIWPVEVYNAWYQMQHQ